MTFAVLSIQCSVNVPASKIPAQAWRPGELGKVKQTIYVEKSGSDLSLRNLRAFGGAPLDSEELQRFGIVGILQPGDMIRIVRCFDYPGSTTGGTHLEGEVLTGDLLGKKVTWGFSLANSVADDSGETFCIPDPKVLERVSE